MEWPFALACWLNEQGVRSEGVSVVIQTGDGEQAFKIEQAFKHQLDRSFLGFDTTNTQAIKYCGLNIEIRALPSVITRLARK